MEPFVRTLLGGGVALLAGLWGVTLVQEWSTLWLLGVGLVVGGVCGLAAGIHGELEY
jgi:hypothetical protein